MLHLIGDVDAVVAGDDVIDEAVLRHGRANRLKAIIKWGIGTDAIDKQAAKAHGIPVYNTPGVFGDEVADLAMTYALLLCRPLHQMHANLLAGKWAPQEGRSLKSLRAGIIGLGSIGLAIAKRAAAFGMPVGGHDVNLPSAAVLREHAVTACSLDELLGNADILFLSCALTPQTYHLMNKETFAKLPVGAYVVNVGRGPLIDEMALINALRSGQIAAAGLDVFETEPLPISSPLRQFPRCVFGPHNGSNTLEAVTRVNDLTLEILWHVLGLEMMEYSRLNRVA